MHHVFRMHPQIVPAINRIISNEGIQIQTTLFTDRIATYEPATDRIIETSAVITHTRRTFRSRRPRNPTCISSLRFIFPDAVGAFSKKIPDARFSTAAGFRRRTFRPRSSG